jgi:hypothetical protein
MTPGRSLPLCTTSRWATLNHSGYDSQVRLTLRVQIAGRGKFGCTLAEQTRYLVRSVEVGDPSQGLHLTAHIHAPGEFSMSPTVYAFQAC